jgi:lysozyme family protein
MSFEECLRHVLAHEGGFVDHPADPGGATNLGCTKAVWEEWCDRPVTVDEIKALTPDDVAPLYRAKYWDAVAAGAMPAGIAYCVFDTAINSGPGRAARFLQAVVGATQDGAIGPRTLAAVNAMDQQELINAYCDKRLAFLQELKTWETFGKGWARRVLEVRRTALAMITSR